MYKKIRRVKSVDFFVSLWREWLAVVGALKAVFCCGERETAKGSAVKMCLLDSYRQKVECRGQKKTCAIPKTGSPPSSRHCHGGGKKATRSPKNGICIKVSRLQQQYYRGISLFVAFFENALPWIKKFHTRIQQLIFYMKKAPAYIINRGFYKTRLLF